MTGDLLGPGGGGGVGPRLTAWERILKEKKKNVYA